MRGVALSRRFTFSATLVGVIVAFGVFGPILAGGDPLDTVGGLYDNPTPAHPLGTDNFGRDVFIQLMYGTRTSLLIGAIAGAVATGIGVVIGTIAGFRGGIADESLMGFTNVVITIPSIVVLLLISIAVEVRSVLVMGLIIGITSWPWTARAVRAQASSVRTREHVDVARLSGVGTTSLIVWEILPYMMSYILMAFVLQLASGILAEAALSLLGLGPSGTVSLGLMLQWALLWESVRNGVWWVFTPPTIFLTIITFALLLMQAGMDEVFNPRLRRA
jgi:peptide/nickel transport system permease protein